ncbi:MAG: transcription termination/antitermination protein NusG [Planctomycetota bacterium]
MSDLKATSSSRWFVLRVPSNLENRMRDKLLQRLKNASLEAAVPSVLVPTESVSEIKGGKKKVLQRKLYPGYLMVEMHLDEEGKIPEAVWFLIRETAGIGDFVGSDRRPVPMDDREVERILSGMKTTDERPALRINFKVGDRVKINEGPFESYNGCVDEVNDAKGIVRVIVTIFGRETPVELEYWQVEAT